MHKFNLSNILIILLCLVAAAAALFLGYQLYNSLTFPTTPVIQTSSSTTSSRQISAVEPVYTTQTIISGLSNPWDMSFITGNIFVYTQRGGEVRLHDLASGEDWLLVRPEDVYVRGEGGMLGALVDVNFSENQYIYTCMNVTGPSVKVIRWQLTTDLKRIAERKDVITGLPSNASGRHSGCRMDMNQTGHLWVGTGDTAIGAYPQDPLNLGGKVLRVDRDGNGVDGNLSDPFDPRIFSYGHRNVQGITLFEQPINGVFGFTSEHGPDRDDEINLLVQGNFGWDPVPGLYNEEVPMTDLAKFPTAISAVWSSGFPTVALSGMTIVGGEQWLAWEGAVLTAAQKGSHVRLQRYGADWNLVRDDLILKDYGRIRTVVQSPEGDIYFLTDNGGGKDLIVQIVL